MYIYPLFKYGGNRLGSIPIAIFSSEYDGREYLNKLRSEGVPEDIGYVLEEWPLNSIVDRFSIIVIDSE